MTDSTSTNPGAAGADLQVWPACRLTRLIGKSSDRVDRRRPGRRGRGARHPARQPDARRRRRLAEDARLRPARPAAPARGAVVRRARRRLEPVRQPRRPGDGVRRRPAAAAVDARSSIRSRRSRRWSSSAGTSAATGRRCPSRPTRSCARRTDRLHAETGVELQALGEVEFFLGKRPEENDIYGAAERGYHASSPFVFGEPLRRRAMVMLSEIGIPVKYGHSEVGYIQPDEVDARIWEQHEIELALQPLPAGRRLGAGRAVAAAQPRAQVGLALQLRTDPAEGPRGQRPALPHVAGRRRRPPAAHQGREARRRGALADRRAGAARRRADGVRQPRVELVRAPAAGQGGAEHGDLGALQPQGAHPAADRGDRRRRAGR